MVASCATCGYDACLDCYTEALDSVGRDTLGRGAGSSTDAQALPTFKPTPCPSNFQCTPSTPSSVHLTPSQPSHEAAASQPSSFNIQQFNELYARPVSRAEAGQSSRHDEEVPRNDGKIPHTRAGKGHKKSTLSAYTDRARYLDRKYGGGGGGHGNDGSDDSISLLQLFAVNGAEMPYTGADDGVSLMQGETTSRRDKFIRDTAKNIAEKRDLRFFDPSKHLARTPRVFIGYADDGDVVRRINTLPVSVDR